MRSKVKTLGMIGLVYLVVLSNSFSQGLTIEQAVESAIENDPVLASVYDKEKAYRQSSVAASRLPDPRIKLGLMNFPTDTWKRNQEPMTQVQIGIQQMFPAGDTLDLKSARALNFASVEMAKAKMQKRNLVRDVRKAWLEYYYWLQAQKVVQKNRGLFRKLVKVTESNYSAGRQLQQHVIRAELELELLDDKESEIITKQRIARARLEKLIGKQIAGDKTEITALSLPALPLPVAVQQYHKALEQHPMFQMQQAKVSVTDTNIKLAKQGYKPDWMVDLTYGARDETSTGKERADFLSAMVSFSVPLFTGNFQDRKVAASKLKQNAALKNLKDVRNKLRQLYTASYAAWQQLTERSERYHKALLVKAKQNSEASLTSYQSGRGLFTDLMKAEITEFNMQLKALRIDVNKLKALAELNYLLGEG